MQLSIIRKWFGAFAIMLLSIIAKAEDFTILDYGIEIQVYGEKGYFDVVETIKVGFTRPRHGINRKIPFQFKEKGVVKEVKIWDISVDGHNYEDREYGSYINVKIGDADKFVEGEQVYVIRYKVAKAFLFLEDRTEFYWNLNGNMTDKPIDSIHFTVKLDKFIPMTEQDYAVFTGYQGQKGKDATINYNAGVFTGSSTRAFAANEGISFAINLPKDYVKRPSQWEVLWEKYGVMGVSGLGFLIASSIFYFLWRRFGKDYPIVKMVEYLPPKDITPSEAGVIIDEKADNVDIIALIPDWAHRGHIHLKRIPQSWGSDDHQLIKVKDIPTDSPTYEIMVFNRLFAGGNTVNLSSLQYHFSDTLSAAKSQLQSHVTAMGIYYPVSMRMQVIATIASVLMFFIGIGIFFVFGTVWPLVAGFGAGLIGSFFSYHMLKRNEKGVHLFQHVQGFKMFVKAAEKDKLERLIKEDPDYFEKTLPYAVIFGYAKEWSSKFDGLLLEPPSWYIGGHMYGHGHFNTVDFGRTFDDSVHEIESVFTSVPEPESGLGGGGGFGSGGGGGFSGGGFGGGGVDSW